MFFRPSFSKDGFYSGYDINGMYTKNSQKEVVKYDDHFIMIIYSWLTKLSHFNIQGTEKYSIAMCYIMMITIMKIMTIMVMIICLVALYDFVFETILMNGKRLDGVQSSLMEFSCVHSQASS